jgi:hypothetical protein
MTFHRYVGLYDRFVDFVIRFEDLFPKILLNFGNYLFSDEGDLLEGADIGDDAATTSDGPNRPKLLGVIAASQCNVDWFPDQGSNLGPAD